MNTQRIKKIAVPILLGLVTLLAFKFMMWNWWKVDRAISMAKAIIKAKPAVNLLVKEREKIIFQKSLPYNTRWNYYLINQFDLSPYLIQGKTADLTFEVNDLRYENPNIIELETFTLVWLKDMCWVFTTSQCDIESFVALKDFLPVLPQTYLWIIQRVSGLP